MSQTVRLFPPTLRHRTPTKGQERVFTSLKRNLSEQEYWVWFKPSLRLRQESFCPDFVVLGAESGLLVMHVEAGPPATGFTRDRKTRKIAKVLGESIPLPVVGWGLVFPEVERKNLNPPGSRRRINPEWCLTREDLSGENELLDALRRLGGSPIPGLNPSIRARIRAVIEPQLHFLDAREEEVGPVLDLPLPGPGKQVSPAESLPQIDSGPARGFWLDRKQERMARELASPRTLVYGPAGSGKTVFLVARAEYWMDRNPRARILFTCYNASLASHLRKVFTARGFSPDDQRLTVRHYHALCGSLLGIRDIHERSPEFYAGLEPRVFQELASQDQFNPYDLILVDEGQDFTRRMVELLVRMVETGGEMTLVCDPAQDIYERWSTDNLAPLRDYAVEHLVDCYRNTAPIFSLALDMLSADLKESMGLGRLEMTRPEDLGRTGPNPELVKLEGLDDLVTLLSNLSKEFYGDGRPLSDLAVLYSSRNAIPEFGSKLLGSRWLAAKDPRFQGDPEPVSDEQARKLGTLHPQSDRDDMPPSVRSHFAEALERELLSRDIPAEWVARDFASKAAYDISKPRLTLSTVHSAKGMDYHTVVLLGTETLNPGQGRDGQRAETLLFTGITRARERLIIPYFLGQGWIPGLEDRLLER